MNTIFDEDTHIENKNIKSDDTDIKDVISVTNFKHDPSSLPYIDLDIFHHIIDTFWPNPRCIPSKNNVKVCIKLSMVCKEFYESCRPRLMRLINLNNLLYYYNDEIIYENINRYYEGLLSRIEHIITNIHSTIINNCILSRTQFDDIREYITTYSLNDFSITKDSPYMEKCLAFLKKKNVNDVLLSRNIFLKRKNIDVLSSFKVIEITISSYQENDVLCMHDDKDIEPNKVFLHIADKVKDKYSTNTTKNFNPIPFCNIIPSEHIKNFDEEYNDIKHKCYCSKCLEINSVVKFNIFYDNYSYDSITFTKNASNKFYYRIDEYIDINDILYEIFKYP